MSKKQIKEELHLDENDLTTWLENKLGHLKPYTTQILLGLGAIFAICAATAYMVNARQVAYADQWRELSLAMTQFRQNANPSLLYNLAEDYPDQKAGMWSLQLASDFDLQSGIEKLARDREAGFADIKRAKASLQDIVDASSSIKSPELQQRSLFSLAYACESLGEFGEAKANYQQLVDNAPDSAFAEPARRGVKRCENPKLIALYESFKNWEDAAEDAPGPNVPDAPSIEFPEIDVDPAMESSGAGGGDFSPQENASADNASEATPESTTASTDESTSTDTSTEEPVEDEASEGESESPAGESTEESQTEESEGGN